MKQSGIYRIVNKINGKGYVGSTLVFNKRKNTHFYWLRHDAHGNQHLQHAWNKYTEQAFEFIILEIVENPTKKLLEGREQYWINFYDAANPEKGYNEEPDAIHHTHSQKTRDKIGLGNKGKFVSKETGEKISKALKGKFIGRKLTPEWKEKVIKAIVGRKHTEESKRKIGLANSGKRGSFPETITRKQDILEFIYQFGYRPSKHSLDPIIKLLGVSLGHYCDQNSRQFDLDFLNRVKEIPTWKSVKKSKRSV
jgi:group I intron endonuclease